MTTKLIELARKINELAKRGIEGEREAAEIALDRLMRKHGITIEDIEGEEKTRCHFAYGSAPEKQLLMQVIASVTKIKSYFVPRNGNTKNIVMDLTAAENIEIEFKYAIYRRLLKEEYEIFYCAFVQKNKIFHPDAEAKEHVEPTPEQKAKNRRILDMAESIKKGNIHKQLATAR